MKIKASVAGDNIQLKFTNVTGAVSYKIYYAVGTPDIYNLLAGGLTTMTYVHTSPAASIYFYKYAAVDVGGTEFAVSDVSVVCLAGYDNNQEIKALIYGTLISTLGLTSYIGKDFIYSQYPTIPEKDPSLTFGIIDSTAVRNWQSHETKRLAFLILSSDTGILDRTRNILKELFSDFAYKGQSCSIERMTCLGDDGEVLAVKDYVILATKITFNMLINTDYVIQIPN